MSVGVRIFLGIVLIQLASATLIIGWYFYSLQSELNDLTRQNADDAVLGSIEATETFFRPAMAIAEAARFLLADDVLTPERPDQLERYFFEQLKLQPQVAGIYAGFPDGGFFQVMRNNEEAAGGTRTKIIRSSAQGRTVSLAWRDSDYKRIKSASDPQDPYDPRTRTWYQTALEHGQSVWTEPYIFFTSRKPGITMAVPVLGADGALAAVLGVDIEIGEISSFLLRSSLGIRGAAYIATPGGEVIAHSRADVLTLNSAAGDDSLRFRSVAELEGIDGVVGGRILERFTEGASLSSTDIWQEEVDGEVFFVAIGQMADVSWPWQIVVLLPKSSQVVIGRGSNVILIAVILLGTGLTCLFGFFLSRSLGRPLATLLRNARLAQNGNVELMEPVVTGYKEIEEVAQSVADLAELRRRTSGEGGAKAAPEHPSNPRSEPR